MGQYSGFPRAIDSALTGSTPMLAIGASDPITNIVHPVADTSANQLSVITQPNGLVVAGPGQWSVSVIPASGAQATITKAAGGAGIRHVCQSIHAAAIATTTAGAGLTVFLRDGPSGTGTVLYSFVQGLIGGSATGYGEVRFVLTGLNIFGSPNTAMTLEYSGGFASIFEVVALTGYSTG